MKDRIKNIKYFLLDLDGTVYLGDKLIGSMDQTLDLLRSNVKKIVFLTNNSSRSENAYIQKLSRLNLYREGDVIYTSGMATADLIKENYPDKSVYLLGTKALKEEFLSRGIALTEGMADISVLSYDTELDYEKLCRFTYNITKGSLYIATHPDVNCPAPEVFVPDAGAFMALVEKSTGLLPSIIVGKPFKTMGENLVKRFNAKKEEFIMVGDRLHTDIRFGSECGFNTLFVLSGECTRDDLASSDQVPTFILDSLNDITEFL